MHCVRLFKSWVSVPLTESGVSQHLDEEVNVEVVEDGGRGIHFRWIQVHEKCRKVG